MRHCFARLTQVAFLLTASSVGEATALMAEAIAAADGGAAAPAGSARGPAGSAAKRQRLTAEEVCRVVQLRIEFAGHDFAEDFL